jgi:hypothetical protein
MGRPRDPRRHAVRFAIDLDDATIASFFDPLAAPLLIGAATTRIVLDISAYQRTKAARALAARRRGDRETQAPARRARPQPISMHWLQ